MWPQEQFCSLTQVRRPVLQQPFRLSAYVQRACSLRHPARILAGIDPADFICNGISFLFAVPAVMGTAFFMRFFGCLSKCSLHSHSPAGPEGRGLWTAPFASTVRECSDIG